MIAPGSWLIGDRKPETMAGPSAPAQSCDMAMYLIYCSLALADP